MKLTIEIPDAVAPRVVAALGADPAPGETQAQAAKRRVIEFIKRQVSRYEGDIALKGAIDKAESEVNLT